MDPLIILAVVTIVGPFLVLQKRIVNKFGRCTSKKKDLIFTSCSFYQGYHAQLERLYIPYYKIVDYWRKSRDWNKSRNCEIEQSIQNCD